MEHLFSGGEQVPETAPHPSPSASVTLPQAGPGASLSVHQAIERILDANMALEEIESLTIAEALRRTDGNLSAAARLLKLRRGQLQYRVDKRAGEA